MCRQQRQPAARQMATQKLHEPVERGGIEAKRRFIQQPQKAWHQSEPRQRKAAFLAGGEKGRGIVGKAIEIEGSDGCSDIAAPQEIAPEFEILDDRQGRLDGFLMRGIMRLLADRELGVAAGEAKNAGGRVAKSGDEAQKRRFARAIGTAQLQELAGSKSEIHIRENHPPAALAGKRFCLKRSEERRVGKECRSAWRTDQLKTR